MSLLLGKALAIVALSMAPGDRVTIAGALTTSWDGSSFDGAALLDPAAGGLAIESQSPGRIVLRTTGAAGFACAMAGVASPCLVPRLSEIAHARMLSVEELRATLRGELEVMVVAPAIVPSQAPLRLALFSVFSSVVALALFVRGRLRAAALGAITVHARAARRATAGDPTLAVLHAEIARLVEEARSTDRARKALARIARGATTVTHAEERAELVRLRSDIATADARLAEIAAALRLIPLRAREHRDLGRALPCGTAMNSVTAELELRERALAEVE